jgi:hypothetical protein
MQETPGEPLNDLLDVLRQASDAYPAFAVEVFEALSNGSTDRIEAMREVAAEFAPATAAASRWLDVLANGDVGPLAEATTLALHLTASYAATAGIDVETVADNLPLLSRERFEQLLTPEVRGLLDRA